MKDFWGWDHLGFSTTIEVGVRDVARLCVVSLTWLFAMFVNEDLSARMLALRHVSGLRLLCGDFVLFLGWWIGCF